MQGHFPSADIKILNSSKGDLDNIFRLFAAAIAYQEKNGYDRWPVFSEELIGREIEEGRHHKLMIDGEVAAVFSVLYDDPLIWAGKDAEPAVYLHRIAVDPVFKGNRLTERIRDWAVEHAAERGMRYVRMDTWGNNTVLREYYISCGFRYLGQRYMDGPETSGHYGGPVLSLFEISL